MARTTPKVAFLGTGTMGAPMATNIAKAGLPVSVWNRTRAAAEPLAGAGATVCSEPADAAQDADLVMTMLFDADTTAPVIDQALTAVKDGAVWAQCATVGLAGCERLSSIAADHDVAYVDSPVLGTRAPAEKGQLVVLASGPESAREICQPAFDAIGTVRRWLGPAGAGSRLKMVVNSWLLAVMSGTATAVALSERLGLDPHLFLETIEGGTLDCTYAHIKADAMMSRSFEPSFTLKGAAKDCGLVLDASSGNGPDLSALRGLHEDLTRAIDRGHGSEDMAALYFGLVGEA